MTNEMSTEPEITLEPCPLCGGDELSHGYVQGGGHMFGNVECHTCDLAITGEDEGAAIRKWNTRHRAEASPSREKVLEDALRKCSDTFDRYVSLHMAKEPPDMDKAAANQEMVEMCDVALATSTPSQSASGGVDLPDIEEEGERIVAETPKRPDGNYLWTDVVGAVQTAIADERARHASPPAENEQASGLGVSEKTRKWITDNIAASKRLMKVSSQQGNGYANFAAHDAHKALTEIDAALRQPPPQGVGERAACIVADGYRCRTCDAVFIGANGHTCERPNWDKLDEEQQVAAIRALASPDPAERAREERS